MKFNNILLSSLIAAIASEEYFKPNPSDNVKPMNVLVSMTFGTRSHIKNVFEIGKELQNRGHSISYMALEPFLKYADGYNITKYQVGPSGLKVDDHRGNSETNNVMVNPLADTLSALIEHLPPIYQMTFNDVLDVIDSVKPDVIVCDFFSPSCIDAAYLRQIPLATGFQTLDGPVLPPPYITGPLSYFPTTVDVLNFPQRFYSSVIHPLTVIPGFFKLNTEVNKMRVKFGIKTTFVTNVGNWDDSLKLCNTFTGFELSRPFEPTMKLIGPIMSDDFAPLTDELSTFLNPKKKVLYVAFGSGVILSQKDVQVIFKSVTELINQGTADGIVWALGKTPKATFKSSNVELTLDDKVLSADELLNNQHPKLSFISWAPQVAILNHRAVRVFLSHGGLESVFESTYSGTPILTMPFYGDQYRNARKAVEMGFGGYTDRFTHTAESLFKQAQTMLDDNDGKIASSILHWQVISRMNSKRRSEAADLLEEMVLTSKICRNAPGANPGASPPCELAHLVPGYHKMNPLIAFGVDVFGVVALLVCLFLTSFGFAIRSLYRSTMAVYNPLFINEKNHLGSKLNCPPSQKTKNL